MKFSLPLLATIICCARCINDASRAKRMERPNYQLSAEFYNTVLYFLSTFQTRSIETLDYMSYFDDTLRDHSNYFLARVRGYAGNETQAAEWEAIAVHVLRIYVVRLCVLQARAYYDSFALACAYVNSVPPLTTQCMRVISAQHFSDVDLDDDYSLPLVDNPILMHELSRFVTTPAIAACIDTPPYLRIYVNYDIVRYINRANYSSSIFPMPYSPYENYLKELSMLQSAIRSITYYWHEIKSNFHNPSLNTTFFKRYAAESIKTLAKNLVTEMTINETNFQKNPKATSMKRNIILVTLLNMLTSFIDFEYSWTSAHPMYCVYYSSYTNSLLYNLNNIYLYMMEVASKLNCDLSRELATYVMSDGTRMLASRLLKKGVLIGYSPARTLSFVISPAPTMNTVSKITSTR